jgi:diacylglycerol kinase (ATP)
MRKRLMLLINPAAGKGGFRTGLAEVLETFHRGEYLTTVYFTTAAGTAPGIVRENAGNYDLVVCIGGDGTLSEVITGLMSVPNPPPIGYIPMGTANDVATTLRLSRSAPEAARQILTGRPIPFDVGVFGTKQYFTYIAAFGAFTEVSYETPQQQKQAFGQLAYIFEGMARLPKLSHYVATVEYDGGIVAGNFIFGGVTNSTSVAGMVRLDDNIVDLGDGMFEVILVRNPKNVLDMNQIVSAVLSKKYDSQHVLMLKSRRVHFTFREPVAWTRDGESGGLHTDVLIENRRAAVRIIV